MGLLVVDRMLFRFLLLWLVVLVVPDTFDGLFEIPFPLSALLVAGLLVSPLSGVWHTRCATTREG